MSGLICAGNVYVDRFDADGNSTGLKIWGNATKFAITESSNAITRISKQKETYGQALDVVTIKKPTAIEISFDEVNKDTTSAALLGTTSDMTATSGTATAETHPAVPGGIIKLAHENVSAVTAETTVGSTALTLGTDYTVLDAAAGLIQITEGGAVASAEDVDFGYSYAADAGTLINGGALPSVNCRLYLDGKNLATGQPVLLDVFSASISPKSAVDFLAETFAPLDLSGTLKTPEGSTSPYSLKLKNVA